MQFMKKSISKLILCFAALILSSFITNVVSYAAPVGYYDWSCGGCQTRQVSSVCTHTISLCITYDTAPQSDTCGVCGYKGYTTHNYYGYICNGHFEHTGGKLVFHGGYKADGTLCTGATAANGVFSGTASHGSNRWETYCPGHTAANPYKVAYACNPSDIGSTGSYTHSATYDTAFNLYNGTNFTRKWTTYYYGDAAIGSSDKGTNAVTVSESKIAGWTTGTTNYNLNQSVKNLTTTKDATVTLYARWGSFSPTIVPSVTKTGYVLLGYTNVQANSGIKMNGDASQVVLKPGTTYTPTSQNEKWYAIWKPAEYTIKFDGNNSKYDTTHLSSIAGKTYKEFYKSTTDNTKTTGTTSDIKVKFDDIIQMPTNNFVKTGNGFYGQTINYNFVGWSQSAYSSYNSNSRITSDNNVHSTKTYYGYVSKANLQNLSYATYLSDTTAKENNNIYFYPNEKIKNFANNGNKLQYNLSNGTYDVTLYASWIAENQRPYTHFRLATKQFNTDGSWNGKIQDIAYDTYPSSIYDYLDETIIYNDMPIYLNTIYYDPEGNVDWGDFTVEYQYSIDGGVTWYQLVGGISTPNFTTKMISINNSNIYTSQSLNNNYVIDNGNGKNYIYGITDESIETNTLLEINFVPNKTTLIRSRAKDNVDYPIMLTNVTRNETTNAIETYTRETLQKPLWSTGYYAKSYSSNVDGSDIFEYTGSANSWNGQKAFVQSNAVEKTSGDNAGWYTKEIRCMAGNNVIIDPTITIPPVVVDFDNLDTYPMYDYTNGNMYLLVNSNSENEIKNSYGVINPMNVLKYRGYVKTLGNGELVDYANKYVDKTTLIRQSLSSSNHEDNINKYYSQNINADESIGFINLSVDKDSYKHYDVASNPTYSYDNLYKTKYYNTGDDKSIVQLDNQFSLYFIAIYDANGTEVLTQSGATTKKEMGTNNTPVNGSYYSFSKAQTGLDKDINGHVYTSCQNMVDDIYSKTGACFAEFSDKFNGKYDVYIGVCDKSWNVYSPNKWAIEKSIIEVEPRLSFVDVSLVDFRQSGYKNEYVLDGNGNETGTKKPETLFVKTNLGNRVTGLVNGKNITFPTYRLSGYTLYDTIGSNSYYRTNYELTQKEQSKAANTDYVADAKLGYATNYSYDIKRGYNFTVKVEAQNADYIELEFYSALTNTKIPVVANLEEDYIGDINNSLLYSSTRGNANKDFIISFPEQGSLDKIYAKVYLHKNTLTNTTHPTSSSGGTKLLKRTLSLGDKNNPLGSVQGGVMGDIGTQITN